MRGIDKYIFFSIMIIFFDINFFFLFSNYMYVYIYKEFVYKFILRKDFICIKNN